MALDGLLATKQVVGKMGILLALLTGAVGSDDASLHMPMTPIQMGIKIFYSSSLIDSPNASNISEIMA